jgi:hypothetical protein
LSISSYIILLVAILGISIFTQSLSLSPATNVAWLNNV